MYRLIMDSSIQVFLLAAIFTVSTAKYVNISTVSGSFLGMEAINEHGEVYHAFLGVRFARAERFSRPVLEPRLTGVYNATYHRDGCIQSFVFEDGRVDGDEDCLFLDIYSPTNHSTGNTKAVMVWIHGGGFVTGNAEQFDSSSLAVQGDVIVVVIQYRLGAFGFISTGDDVLAGNYGLWDQLTALKWVKDTIGYFGGNPERVTIFGNSAGACSVNMHLVSAKTKGLFQRAVSQSSYYCIRRNPFPITYALAKLVNCFPANHQTISKRTLHVTIKQCFLKMDARKLCKASWPLVDMKDIAFDVIYSPTVDGDFTPNHLYNLLADREYLQTTSFPNADVMMSVNNAEGGGLYLIDRHLDKTFKTSHMQAFRSLKHFQSQLLIPYLSNRFGINSEELENTLSFEYTYPLNFTDAITKDPGIKFITDDFVTSATDLATAHATIQGPGKTYLYLFDHNQTLAHSPFKGMTHGFDMVYTFGFSKRHLKVFTGSANKTVPPSERQISRALIAILTDFSKTGNPSMSLSEEIPDGWPEFTTSSESYLALNANMSVREHPYPRVTSLWRNLVPRLVLSARNRLKLVTNVCQTSGKERLMEQFIIWPFVFFLSIKQILIKN